MPTTPAFVRKNKSQLIVFSFLLVIIPASIFSYALMTHRIGPGAIKYTEVKSAAIANEQLKKRKDILTSAKEQITLPTDEEPIFATVSNKDLLDKQDFFKDAQNGDKILMYRKNKKAYLYRPSTKQVITMAVLQYGTPTANPEASGTTSALLSPAPTGMQKTQTDADNIPQGKVLIRPDF